MTPTEDYAQKRAEAVEFIRLHAPELFQNALIELLRPAIALKTKSVDDAQIPLGASKFGGAPDAPSGFEWPMWNDKPLGFLAQVNLEEVAPFDIENLLPKSGLLSFFRRFDEIDEEVSRVYHLEEKGLQRVLTPEGIAPPYCEIIPPQLVTFSPEWTTREFYREEVEGIWDYNTYLDQFLPAFGRTKSVHRILGEPILVHDPIFVEAEMKRTGLEYQGNEEILEAGAQDWRLLLQLDFKEPDCYYGVAYFLICKHYLAARCFDKSQFFYHGD